MATDTMRLMQVSAPSDTKAKKRETRLAGNVAVLFGVAAGVAPERPIWVSRLEALNLSEIGDGGPNPPPRRLNKDGDPAEKPSPGEEMAPEFREFMPVAAATLNRFRPDRKSGAVLDGATGLFRPLVPTFRRVLRLIGLDDDGLRIAEEIRLAIWAVLVLETYRSQPALFVGAVTARRIQRALATAANPYFPPGIVTNHIEQDSPPSNQVRDTDLDILDATIRLVSEQEEVAAARAADDDDSPDTEPPDDLIGESGSSVFLREDRIERWLKHLMESDDRGFTWVVADGDRHTVEAFVSPLASLNAFMDEVAPTLRMPAAKMLLPRIPPAAELIRADPPVKRAAIWAIIQVHRLLRDNGRYNDPGVDHEGAHAKDFQAKVTRDAHVVADLAEAVLHAGDPLIVWARAKAISKTIVDVRETDPERAVHELDDLRASITEMKNLYHRGRIDPGAMADFLHSLTSIVTAVGGDARYRGDHETAERIFTALREDWQMFFEIVGLAPETLLPREFLDPELVRKHKLLATHVHNYVNALVHSDVTEELRLAFRLEREVIVPARRELSAARQSDSALRLALQTLIRAAVSLARVSEADRDACVEAAISATSDLIETRSGSIAVFNGEQRPEKLRSGQVNALTAIVAGVELAERNGRSVPAMSIAQALKLAEVAEAGLLERSNGVVTGRLGQLRELAASLRSLAGAGGPG